MDEINFGPWRIACDVAETEAAYGSRLQGSPEECGCRECRNFVAARHAAYPPAARALLAQLGVTPIREAEIFHGGPVDDGQHVYGGWFHIVGQLVSGPDAKVPIGPTTGRFGLVPVAGSFEVGFTRDTMLVPPGFPPENSLLQVEFQTRVPWVLEEPYVE